MAKTKIHGEYLDPSVISGQTQVTAVGADSMLIFDATDNALKKALLSDLIETVGATPSFTSLTVSDSATDYEGLQVLNTNTAASPTTSSILLGITNSVRNVYTKIQTIEGGSDANETRLAFYTNNTSNTLTEALRCRELLATRPAHRSCSIRPAP